MANEATKTATLSIDGADAIELPVYAGAEGPDVIDVGKLTAQGYFTYDPGFVSTASCDSEITYIDGDQGVLLHRGYPIEQLAEHSIYLELCYLLLNGELPSQAQHDEFVDTIKSHTMVHEQLRHFFQRLSPRRAPHGDHVWRYRGTVCVLSRLARHRQRDTPHDHRSSADREDADARRDELQIRAGPAVHLPT